MTTISGSGADSTTPPPSGESARSAYATLLRNRNYRFWFLSALGSGIGDWAGLVALQVLVTRLSEPGSQLYLFALGGIMMARLLPSILIGPVAGVLADRYDRKRLMVFTNLCRGGMFAVIAFSTDVWALLALTFLVECLTLLFISAKDASLPLLVRRDQLQPASQLNLLATFGPLPFGAVVATAMIPVAALLRSLGVAGANATVLTLLVNAATFVVSAALLSKLVLPEHGRRASRDRPVGQAAQGGGMLAELREGLEFIRDLPVIRALITGVVGVFFGAGVVISLGPAFVTESLQASSDWWYAVMTAVGIGLVIGLVSVPLITRHLSRERTFPVMLVATGLLATVTAMGNSLSLTLGLSLGLGAAAGLSLVLGYTLLQEHTEDHVRGKTFATFYVSTRLAMFAALALAPFLAGVIDTGTLILGDFIAQASGIRIVIVMGGAVATYAALVTMRAMYRSLRRRPAKPVTLGQIASSGTSGTFIAVEGIEGSGKSTQVRRLAETLRKEGYDVVVTREPGGPPVAERIRAMLLDPNSAAMEPRTEALLLAAARAEHVNKTIEPALSEGKVVVCDRFLDSSLAYQGHARGLGESDVFEINRWAIGGLLPDVTVLLHMEPAEGLRRAVNATDRNRGAHLHLAEQGEWEDGGDRIEREDAEFHQRVADGFLRLARRERQRFCVVDATGDVDEVARQVRSGLHAWLPLPSPRDDEADVGRGSEAG